MVFLHKLSTTRPNTQTKITQNVITAHQRLQTTNMVSTHHFPIEKQPQGSHDGPGGLTHVRARANRAHTRDRGLRGQEQESRSPEQEGKADT